MLVAAPLQAVNKAIPDLPAVSVPTLSDQVELWQPGGSAPHDHNMTLGQAVTFFGANGLVPATLTINGHALSGNISLAYGDLTGLPTLFDGTWGSLTGKPTLFDGAWGSLTGKPSTLSGYGITDPIVLTSGAYNDPAWLTHLAWSKIASTPTTLSGYGITNAVANTITVNGHALSGNVAVTAADLSLGNVTNTSDANKPVSTAQQTALDLKANLSSPTFTNTPAAPTAAPGTNTTQLATTAFVLANAGGGGQLVRGSGTLTGYTNTPVAGYAANALFQFIAGAGLDGDTITISVDGNNYIFENDTGNNGPQNGGSYLWTSDDPAGFWAAVQASPIAGLMTFDSSNEFTVTSSAAPQSVGTVSVLISNTSTCWVQSVQSTGVDAVVGSGNVAEVTLIAGVAGKKVKVVSIYSGLSSLSCPYSYYLKSPGGAYTQIGNPYFPGYPAIFDSTNYLYWLAGKDDGESLVAKYTGVPGQGTSATPIAIVEQY